MQQAILITAYKNFDHLEAIIRFFDGDFKLYIHIDRKSKMDATRLETFKNYQNVALVSTKYNVNWGGFYHLKAILHLSREALKDKNNQYFHLISGHDFPTKSLSAFQLFFQENHQTNYLEYFKIPKQEWLDRGIDNGGLERIDYFHLNGVLNVRKSDKLYAYSKRFLRWQQQLGFKRKLPAKMPPLYSGSTWWSLNREALDYVDVYSKIHKNILNRFKYTFCSEEFYFQTLLVNSDFAPTIVNDNLRHIEWTMRNGNSPANLDATDYEKLIASNAFFARKFEYPVSVSLLDKIMNGNTNH
ncbi:MAG: beta-1,6-N-acetylglucosaminyltransferase [Flavobacterium sp.]|nr:beta-1,6-N-acetylglucosaminyltransferase [Flavobacterium sp.]